MRILAINNLAASGKPMERARLSTWTLYVGVAGGAVLVAIHLLVWTILDPVGEQFEYEVTRDQTPQGDTIVHRYGYCGSENDIWYYLQFAWRGALLVPACLIASLALRVKEDMNDTKSLSIVFFVKFVILIAMVVGFSMWDKNSVSVLMGYWSLLLSVDTIVSLSVFILPKFWDSKNLEADPLPDVFVHTTVAFLDITGFTAW
jgi:7 transmembrane sweet-taste receptor of 3 GCPR